MGKIWVEVGLISARGLRRSSFLKLQWFAVGWIDPRNKYCTKIDASGGTKSEWNTKFAALVDVSEKELQELELNVEVYGREPVFLTERLQGRATVVLKEFLEKQYSGGNESSGRGVAQTASYQLRKLSSSKPQGFVDISVRVTEEVDGDIELADHDIDITLSSGERSTHAHPKQHLPIVRRQHGRISADIITSASPRQQPHIAWKDRENHSQEPTQESHQDLSPGRAYYPPAPAQGLSHQPSATTSYSAPRAPPPPPQPPSNVGLVPTFLPRITTSHQPGGRTGNSPDFAMGMGAGALAAGAVIFGDDFLEGFDVTRRSQDDTRPTASTYPPF